MYLASDPPIIRPSPSPAAMGIPTFHDLNLEQILGEECVVLRCRLVDPAGGEVPESVVVGVSLSTGKPVRACTAHARLVGWAPDSGWEQLVLSGYWARSSGAVT